MASMSKAILSRSDQLNFIDIGSNGEMTLVVVGVDLIPEKDRLRTVVHYQNENGKPYKPSLGMVRVLTESWGDESDDWVGKYVKVFGDPTVRWAGKEVGGIFIRALSNIDKKGVDIFVQKNRSTRVKVHFNYLEIETTPADQTWIDAIKKNPSVIDQIEDPAYKSKIENLVKNG